MVIYIYTYTYISLLSEYMCARMHQNFHIHTNIQTFRHPYITHIPYIPYIPYAPDTCHAFPYIQSRCRRQKHVHIVWRHTGYTGTGNRYSKHSQTFFWRTNQQVELMRRSVSAFASELAKSGNEHGKCIPILNQQMQTHCAVLLGV